MNVAGIELCKELYELLGWDGLRDNWYHQIAYEPNLTEATSGQILGTHPSYHMYPAYDAGYLLRKLPGVKLEQIDIDFWNAQFTYDDGTELPDYKTCDADTPENCLCRLAIELFKAKVLTQPEPEKQ